MSAVDKRCKCGIELPTHIAKLVRAGVTYKHQCSCDREWGYEAGVWVDKGMGAPNPFMLNAKQRKAAKHRKPGP